MERSFKKEVASLRLAQGQIFHGEGILAVAKALLQSGVSYISGYQGAPVSHLLDVLGDAGEILDELGVHFEPAANEAGAAAMLAASISYPLRGAVTWKSIVGTNVASDALSNLASAGVKGGTLIVLGEDYGEGASVIQERSHAIALKSQIWLLDPRPNLPSMVDMVEKSFQLSEASNTPVMLELRIRACHVHGSFECKDNRAAKYSRKNPVKPAPFDFAVIPLPPSIYLQEKHKIEARLPAALKFIRAQRLNEFFEGSIHEVGIVLQGGLYNTVIRALQELGLADVFGDSSIPLCVLNVTYPLVPEELTRFCHGKRAVLVVEEGQPAFIEEAINSILRRADQNDTFIVGKEVLPAAGEYTGEAVLNGLAHFLQLSVPDGVDPMRVAKLRDSMAKRKAQAASLLPQALPPRPPGFCVGCPERPVFSALKLLQKEIGKIHISADIGCHTFSTLAPFSLGNTVVGYGLGLASSAAIAPMLDQRVVSIMGDGGFWHQGFTTGIANAVFRQDDSVLVILKNGYTSATGAQQIPSSQAASAPAEMNMQAVLRATGVSWLRTVPSYEVGAMLAALRAAFNAPHKGLKIIIAEGECQLERQRRERAAVVEKIALKQRTIRTIRTRFGIDADICTGDRSCIRLSGCPSLTLKENPDALRDEPVTTVNASCVGCGTCGEVAHAATLCPSFYKVEIIQNASRFERFIGRLRHRIIGSMQRQSA